jgi:hypothetical protein
MSNAFYPKVGEMYYFPTPTMPELINNFEFLGSDISKFRADNGLCYPPTEEGYNNAIIHAIVMLKGYNMELLTVKAYKDSGGSVTLYLDNKQVAYYPPEYTNKPTKRNKHITLNCFKFKLQWVD